MCLREADSCRCEVGGLAFGRYHLGRPSPSTTPSRALLQLCAYRVCARNCHNISHHQLQFIFLFLPTASPILHTTLRSRLVPPATSAGQPTECVCATQPGALCGVCSSRGRGWERGGCGERSEPARDATRAAVSAGCPSPSVCVRPPGWRRARALESKRCVVAAQPQVCGRGVTSG